MTVVPAIAVVDPATLAPRPNLDLLATNPECLEFLPPERRLDLYREASHFLRDECLVDGVDEPEVLLRKKNDSVWLFVRTNPLVKPAIVGTRPFGSRDCHIFPGLTSEDAPILYDSPDHERILGEALPEITAGIGALRQSALAENTMDTRRHSARLRDVMIRVRGMLISNTKAHTFVMATERR